MSEDAKALSMIWQMFKYCFISVSPATHEFCIVLISVLIFMLDVTMMTETWKRDLTISWRKRVEGNNNILIMSFFHLFLLIYIAQRYVLDLLNAVRESPREEDEMEAKLIAEEQEREWQRKLQKLRR